MDPKDRIIVALDLDDEDVIKRRIDELRGHVGLFKFGLEAINAIGARRLKLVTQTLGVRVFLDGKLNDIPETIAGATRQQAGPNVEFLNVHACSGIAGLKAAVANKGDSKVLAVTVLTSMDDDESIAAFGEPSRQAVARFARSAFHAGVDGLVCSPREIGTIRLSSAYGYMTLVTPGVRPAWYAPPSGKRDGQKRVMTPGEAAKAGADYLVIGRPILEPPPGIGSPADAARRIADEIAEAFA